MAAVELSTKQSQVQGSGVSGHSILAVSGLRTEIRTDQGVVHAVDDVSFAISRGRTLAIVGESGCGKSMTALSIMGLLPKPQASVVAGEVRFDGRDLLELPPHALQDIRGKEIAMIFQDPMTSLNPTLTIGLQITETLRRHLGLKRAQAAARAADLLGEVGIANPQRRLGDYPHQFSGGMRQRVMIAIAICCEPKLLIADEPTTALDVTVQAMILDLLHRLRDERDMGLLLITHDMGVVADIADETLVMYAGQVVEKADVYELFDHPEHPYTRALLQASPTLTDSHSRTGRLSAIPGMPPSLIDTPAGCRFAPRCRYTERPDGCAQHPPELREIRQGHYVRTAHPISELQEATG
jgi:oligopeptide/dipeptide ABC transporter ATP-binding protein